MNSALQKFLSLKDKTLFHGNIAILCNQISFNFDSKKYLFEILNERGVLRNIFVPEHGLFAELQDQINLDQTDIYSFFKLKTSFTSLYGNKENTIYFKKEDLKKIDAFIVDIQDVGSRYYTYISTINNLFLALKHHDLNTKVYVIDRPNPAGRKVEGTPLSSAYASFIGIKGIPNRHGLTIGEMCTYLRDEMNAKFNLKIIPFQLNEFHDPFLISPSPNFPSLVTAQIYTGQCLFEGTVLSEGRGTTKPFELIGAPFLTWEILQKINDKLYKDYPFFFNKLVLRPTRFIPTDHKFKGEVCFGFQLHILNSDFHSLLFSLVLIQYINRFTNQSIWGKGKYEYGSDKTAIELLVGDKKILNFLKTEADFKALIPYLQKGEKTWIKRVKKHLIYPIELSVQKDTIS